MSWLGAAILILVLALTFQFGLLAYAMYTLVGIILLSRWLTQTWSQQISAERELNKLEVNTGAVVAVIATIQNRGRLPVPWALVEDLLPKQALIHNPPKLALSGRRVMLAGVKGGGIKRIMYQMKCNRRGYYQIGPLVLETGDVFGLHRKYRMLAKPVFLTVLPDVVPLTGYDIASRRPLGEVRITHRLYEDPTRHAGVREYEPGDPLQRIHWGATARTGTLHSKIYEPSTVAGATILLDFHKEANPAQHEPVRSELAVTAAASLAHYLYDMGQQVGLVTNGRDAADRVRTEGWDADARTRTVARESALMSTQSDRLRPQVHPPQRGPEQLRRLQLTLARVELTEGMRLHDLLLETAHQFPRDASVIAILQEVPEASAVALGNLKRQGLAVTAILNVHDEYDFSKRARPLLAEGIPTHHLRDAASIATIAKRQLLGMTHSSA